MSDDTHINQIIIIKKNMLVFFYFKNDIKVQIIYSNESTIHVGAGGTLLS